MENEIWKDIDGYEGLYQVSNLGNVKSIGREIKTANEKKRKYKEVILKQGTTKNGYANVVLSINNKMKTKSVHRLVAKAFIINPENKPQVNHIDGNKKNNCVKNLEWVTNSENMKHSWDNQLQKVTKNKILASKINCSRIGKLGTKKVNQYDLKGNLIKSWNSIIEVEINLSINNSNITSVCKGKRKTAGGYIWRDENKKWLHRRKNNK